MDQSDEVVDLEKVEQVIFQLIVKTPIVLSNILLAILFLTEDISHRFGSFAG